MGFESIWGTLNLGTPSKTIEEEDKTIVKKDDVKPADETAAAAADDDDVDDKGTEDKIVVGKAEGKADDAKTDDKTDDKTAAKTATVYSDEQLDSTFELLDSQGILDLDDEEEVDATPEGIAAAVATSIRRGIDKGLSEAPESVKRLYTHLQGGGSEEDFEFIKAVEPWSEMNEDDEDNQRLALTEFYLSQEMTLEEAEEEVEDVIASGKLERKSATAFKSLIAKEAATKVARQEATAATSKANNKKADDEIAALKTKIKGIDSIAGFKMTDVRKKEFEDYLFKVDGKTGKTQLQRNMSDEDRKLKIAFLDYVEFNQADITKEVENTLTQTRKRKLTRYSGKTAANSNSSITVKKDVVNKGKIVFPSIFSPEPDKK